MSVMWARSGRSGAGKAGAIHVALLDDLHSMPMEVYKEAAEKLFTCSMEGLYLFVFKLSVHFCRLHENVDRSPQIATA